MNIMFIIPQLSGGGAERVTSLLASEYSIENKVYIVTHRAENGYDISDDVEIIDLNLRGRGILSKEIHFISAVNRIKKLKRQLNIDCSISMLQTANFENIVTRTNERVIISIRNVYTQCNFSKLMNRMCFFANKKADRIVALSKGVECDSIANYGADKDKIVTIYNPCNIKRLMELRNVQIKDKKFEYIRSKYSSVFISAGRLVEQKGQWHLIKAFAAYADHRRDVCLILLGEGELENNLQKMISDYEMEDQIFLLGFKNNIFPYLYRSDYFVFSSLFEGFGNILIEAMACGLPIISSDYREGARELLAPNTDWRRKTSDIELAQYGILVREMENDILTISKELSLGDKALVKAMKIISEDKKVYELYKNRSAERINDFSIDIIKRQWDKYVIR